MDFKKCKRCGCFFSSPEQVCPNCEPKDNFEMSKLRNYIEDGNITSSLNGISNSTGISIKNLSRYLEQDEFIKINSMLNNSDSGNLGISI